MNTNLAVVGSRELLSLVTISLKISLKLNVITVIIDVIKRVLILTLDVLGLSLSDEDIRFIIIEDYKSL